MNSATPITQPRGIPVSSRSHVGGERGLPVSQCAPEGLTLWPPADAWSLLLISPLIMRPRPPILSPLPTRSRRKRALVTQWSVQLWKGPLLQSHGRLVKGLLQPCELYFLTSCPEAHDSLIGHGGWLRMHGAFRFRTKCDVLSSYLICTS